MLKKLFSLLLTFTFILSFNVFEVDATEIDELEGQQSEIEENIQNNQNLIEETQSQIQITENELTVIDKQLTEAREKLVLVKNDVDKTNLELEEIETKLAETRAEYDRKFELFKERVRVMYEFGDVTYLEVLLGSESLNDFFTRLEYVNSIANHDKEIVDDLIAMEEEISIQLAEVEVKKAELDVLLLEQTNAAKELNIARSNKASLITSLESNVESYQSKVDELEQTSNDIEVMIKELQEAAELAAAQQAAAELAANNNSNSSSSGGTASYNGGTFAWPIPGRYSITSEYGTRTHPLTGVVKTHTGVDIGATTGDSIVAGADGTVITSGYLNGYGNTVIIDHGNGFSTLYGHNSGLDVSVGEYVTRGQHIARAGSTGFSTGPHCHFEVRVSGSHVDPMPYLGS
ncbi:MAG: murein hydrolase activator EnvC family protein [Lachnospirales bacterium]